MIPCKFSLGRFQPGSSSSTTPTATLIVTDMSYDEQYNLFHNLFLWVEFVTSVNVDPSAIKSVIIIL